jgi:hypothetical protein
MVTPPTPTAHELMKKLKELRKEELRLVDLVHKQLITEIEQLKKEEDALAAEISKCRAKREDMERQLKQATPATPDGSKKCNPCQNSGSDANIQNQFYNFQGWGFR